MTILEIECFLAICQYKTASRAAKALYITQPSLSNRLKTLEREVGGALFYRHKGNDINSGRKGILHTGIAVPRFSPKNAAGMPESRKETAPFFFK